MILLDDIIPQSYQNHIEEIAMHLPFFWHNNTSYDPSSPTYSQLLELVQLDKNIVDNGQFICSIYEDDVINNNQYGILFPLIHFFADAADITVNQIVRIRVNMLLQDKTFEFNNYNYPHTDPKNTQSFIYYVNDSDGDTVFFKESDTAQFPSSVSVLERVSPKKGRGIFFNSSQFHSSCNPRNTQARCIINFNFI
jgi:hypothetical protein